MESEISKSKSADSKVHVQLCTAALLHYYNDTVLYNAVAVTVALTLTVAVVRLDNAACGQCVHQYAPYLCNIHAVSRQVLYICETQAICNHSKVRVPMLKYWHIQSV